jgi:hypothetical protein
MERLERWLRQRCVLVSTRYRPARFELDVRSDWEFQRTREPPESSAADAPGHSGGGLWKAARLTALTMPVAGTEERLQPFSAVLGLTERASHSFLLAGPCRRAPRIERWRALCVPWRTDGAGSLLYSSRCQG